MAMLLYLSVDYPNLNPISSRAPLPPIVVLTPLYPQTPCPMHEHPCPLPHHRTYLWHDKADTSLSSHIWWIWKGGPAYDVLCWRWLQNTQLGWGFLEFHHKFHIHAQLLHFGWEKVGGVCWRLWVY